MSTELPLEHYISVSLAEDKLTASIQIVTLPDSFPYTVNDIIAFLHKNHVRYGIQRDVIAALIQDPKPFVQTKTVVATGDPPGPGIDGEIRNLYDADAERKKPAELEDGTVDYKEVTRLTNVRKGQLIAERLPAKEGPPGRDVTGETIPGRSGKEARFKLGKNVVADGEQKALYAAMDGMVVYTENDKINVFPVFEVNGDVDYNVGNIDFLGTVVIRGNVLSGFKVKAAGDIRVTGGVEGAEIEALGSIEISAGILGHNKAVIRAGVNLKSSFIQDAVIEAGQNVVVSQSIMHSQVRAGQNVQCAGPKGLIVGGTIQAGEKVIARTIGNPMSTPTSVEVGVLPELRNELTTLRQQLKQNQDGLDKTEKALTLLDQLAAAGTLSSDKLAMRIKLTHTKKQAVDEQNGIKERILEIEKTLEDTDRARVQVISMVYGGTKIVIGRYTRFVKDATSRVQFMYSAGDISMLPNE
ncbi:DUF342 domain-containing protein [Paenibacillus flagellatus]|uniref:DUF342 domain-containing protein n=1 Tax=Paenibacillus flagellatus TaxID=2211139 RepID=A0A2V5JYY6_9BACL|nr:FapA family protein [Paenibacillus flagellatus]PYI50393.1 DUF342 domain-containing protein [Paenibacillus flagellatus]